MALWGKYTPLARPLTSRARTLGYALGVHGSLERDLDLIAVPWTEEAVEESSLASALCEETRRVLGWVDVAPGTYPQRRPHGRLAWSLRLTPESGPYIDLSVMPRREN